jgi:flagellar basal body rod protein FlgG
MSGRGVYVALSGALAQQTLLDSTAHDLANASTEGFTRSRMVFREVLASQAHFTSPAETVIDAEPGPRRVTGRNTDFALPRGMFLAVQGPRGERYTRACSLAVAPDGIVRTQHGHAVLDQDGKPVRASGSGSIAITRSGEFVDGDRTTRLRIVSFERPERLAREEGALLGPGAAGKATPEDADLDVGAVEESNANVSTAIIDVVEATRAFEAFQRAIDAFNEADRRAATVGRPP